MAETQVTLVFFSGPISSWVLLLSCAALGALVQHCYLLNTVFPCLHDVWFFLLQLRSGSPFFPTPRPRSWEICLGRLSPHPHRSNTQQCTPHGVVSSRPSVWACSVSPDMQDDQGRAPLLSYVAFWGSTVVSLEVLDGLMWLFPDCSNLTLHDQGLQRSSNLSTYLLKADGELFP